LINLIVPNPEIAGRGHFIRRRYLNETQILLGTYRFISRLFFARGVLSHLPILRSKIKIDEAIKETEIKHPAS